MPGVLLIPLQAADERLELLVLEADLVDQLGVDDDALLERTASASYRLNEEIDEDKASAVREAGIEKVKVRSVLTCAARRGVCKRCYGRDLATGRLVELGQAVGVIAAQSIGGR